MKYLDEYRDPQLAKSLIEGLQRRSFSRGEIRLMEICGTHTVAIFRSGLRQLLPPQIKLISGPGCPVCVTANEDIDRAIWLARQPGVIMTTFGDLVRVPGSSLIASYREEQRGRRPDRLCHPGRAPDRPRQPGPASRVHRHRVRNHRADRRRCDPAGFEAGRE